ncbi:hypothetical protein EV140_2332 [Microcella alkaliphila]|jgi:hypothetical protein|uniref:SAF domain-containing protein n=1 Tax=Microcella alkaliphila TaxID=279828 RepID=A0A4Q7TCH5_9MICO|nr:hypothetical protein [Microcella alkaliphila]RZT58094.1 hypothetical protein EV140_2332 [Microcella alkaliphila]
MPLRAADRPRRVTDPRLIIGLALVAASVAAVVGIVAVNDDGVEVYAAPRALVAGELVTAADLELRTLGLGADARHYLDPATLDEGGVIVARTVGAGELVPLGAVGDARGAQSTTVVVALATPLSATVRAGDTLDLWSAPAIEGGRFGAPSVIASSAQLVRTIAAEGVVATGEAGRVELLVPRRDVARILHAQANRDALSAVPASLAVAP